MGIEIGRGISKNVLKSHRSHATSISNRFTRRRSFINTQFHGNRHAANMVEQ
jgi:hypothetical protein